MLPATGTNDSPATSRAPALVWSWLVVLLIVAVFITACCLPAVKALGGFWPGWACLTFGIILLPLWLANPLLFAGCVFLAAGRNTTAFLLGLPASFLAIFASVLEVSWGYYLWAGDMALLTGFAGVMAYLWGDRELPRVPPAPEPAETAEEPPAAEDVTKVFSGPVVLAELYQQALAEVGIETQVVGLDLAAGLGSALPNSVELWVKQRDAGPAALVLKAMEPDR